MRTLYFDCFAGASGNMILGALVSLGIDQEELRREVEKLNTAAFQIEFEKVMRSGISAVHAQVRIPVESKHRHLNDILRIIEESPLADRVKRRSVDIFRRLAEAEAKVHGIEVGEVHFHEVGALDAIVDVVGSCIGFEMLGIESFACSKIHVGSGFVEIEHGKFPVPPPAVSELLRGIPIYSTEVTGELMTPTGAAIISALSASYGVIPEMAVEQTGYGAGTRVYDKFPNVLRLMVGESEAVSSTRERVAVLETNIDDISPQFLVYVMERALAKGALDCWFTPIQMKKNRPATLLSILCRPEDTATLTELIYSETTTLGVRVTETERECLEREIVSSLTPFGRIDVKIARSGGKTINVMPEYDQVRKAAIANNVPFRVVHTAAIDGLQKSTAVKGVG
jgi:uncharacterized protein (TIGR00299 family) protein